MRKIGALWAEGNLSPYQLKDRTHFPDWHSLIVWDAFFNNLTSGLMLIAAITWACGPLAFTTILPLALTVALILVIVDLGILIMDLGDPWRFGHALRVMRFTSPLSVGVWGLVSYSTFLALAMFFSWLLLAFGQGDNIGSYFIYVLSRLFTVMATIGAIVVICYKGVVFSCTSQPGVANARWLPPFMISDSLLMGLSLYILIGLAFFPDTVILRLMIPLLVLIVARCVTFILLWQDVKTRARKVNGRENMIAFLAVYGGGILAFILAPCGFFGLALASIICIGCGVVERYWLISIPRPYSLLKNASEN